MKKIALGAISLYQVTLSPFYGLFGPGSTCRFHPSCSSYGREAIEKYGAMKGGWLTMKRISRCNPFGQGGFDPVL